VFAGEYKRESVRWQFASESRADYDFSRNVRLE
jgi:hypothetical protein